MSIKSLRVFFFLTKRMPKCSTLIMLLVIIKDNPLIGSPQYPSVEGKINSKLASEFW